MLHIGDISYARGFEAEWEQFMDHPRGWVVGWVGGWVGGWVVYGLPAAVWGVERACSLSLSLSRSFFLSLSPCTGLGGGACVREGAGARVPSRRCPCAEGGTKTVEGEGLGRGKVG